MSQISKPSNLVISDEKNLQNLNQWIQYFSKLSPRIFIRSQRNTRFDEVIKEARSHAEKRDGEKICISDWPKTNNIAFFVAINSTPRGRGGPIYEPGDAYVFCIPNYAFGIKNHQCDTEHKKPSDKRKVFSLEGIPKPSLEWLCIANRIIERIKILDNH